MDEPTQTLNPATLASEIAKDAPRVAQTAAEPQPAPAIATESAGPSDKSGRAWDPTKYRTNADGSPFVNKFGNYMPAPRARGSAKAQPQQASETATAPAPRAESTPESVTPAWSEAERAEALTPQPAAEAETAAHAQPPIASPEATAEVASNAIYTLAGAALGNHKAARPGSAEHTNIKKTLAAYLASKGLVIAGGAAVLVTVAAYLVGEERREIVVERIKTFVASLRKKAEPQTVRPEPAQTDPVTATPQPTPQTALRSAFNA